MQVEEDYNPIDDESEQDARIRFIQRKREKEAKEARSRYLGVPCEESEGASSTSVHPIRSI